MHPPHAPIVVIAGPTASGKTAVAVELAKRIHAEIISADSMQVYRHLSIGTAKPRVDELHGIPYHLIDHVEPEDQYHLGRFVAEADALVEQIRQRGHSVIVCGGTGLYIRGLVRGIFGEGAAADDIRRDLEQKADQPNGLATLYADLQHIDPQAASRIRPADRVRIVRALEVFYATGKPISDHQQQFANAAPRLPHAMFVLQHDTPALNRRIEQRAQWMVTHGFREEVAAYLAAGHPPENPAFRALGYRAMVRHLAGECSLQDVAEETARTSRQYAKRQRTWFRAEPEARAVPAADRTAGELADDIARQIA